MKRVRPHHWLTAVPALGILAGVPFANRVHEYVFGLPFLLAWILGCVLLTSAVMALVGALDRRAEAGAQDIAAHHAAERKPDAGDPGRR
jgi:Protein of unknown function (DUF3311)